MANKKVALVRLCKTPNGWRRYPAVIGKNGRVKPGYVKVAGHEEHYTEGKYQLRRYEGSRMVYVDASENAADALTAKQKAEKVLNAKHLLEQTDAKVEITNEPQRKNLRRELEKFIDATKARGSMEAAAVYETAGQEFLSIVDAVYGDELSPEDVSKFLAALRKRNLSDRTVANRHQRVMAFFRYLGVDKKKLSPTKPKFEQSLPEIYSDAELKLFFASITDKRLELIYELLLKTGMREQEAMHLRWADINFERGVLRVRSNPEWDFKVKDSEQRDIPVPQDLLDRLKAWREEHPGKLVTGTRKDKPDSKLLRSLKKVVSTANLGCMECDTCLERDECERWFLHKFRATYITKLLRSGMDLRTVMKLSGHSDIESVMRYLSPASSEAIQEHVAGMQWM